MHRNIFPHGSQPSPENVSSRYKRGDCRKKFAEASIGKCLEWLRQKSCTEESSLHRPVLSASTLVLSPGRSLSSMLVSS